MAHSNGTTGSGADIAIIDTGIDSTHPDLQANLGTGKSFVLPGGSAAWQDDNGHGTHCAGIANAVNNGQGVVGVSTEATLHAVKVLAAAGTGSTSAVAAGIEYTADQGWDVGSLSLGSDSRSKLLRDACQYAAYAIQGDMIRRHSNIFVASEAPLVMWSSEKQKLAQ